MGGGALHPDIGVEEHGASNAPDREKAGRGWPFGMREGDHLGSGVEHATREQPTPRVLHF